MPDNGENNRPEKTGNRRVHMANERTFLAWIRTSVAIMAFGFVVEKFALFVREITFFIGKDHPGIALPQSHGYSSMVGIFLVAIGTLVTLLAFVRYKKVTKQIDRDTYRPSSPLDLLLTVSIVSVGIFLVIYLMRSV